MMTSTSRWFLRGTLVFLLLNSARTATAQDATAPRWNVQESAHFELYYRSPQRPQVDAVAREAERAYSRISVALGHELAAKMPIILVEHDRDLPSSEDQAALLVIASRAPLGRDHLVLSVETFEKRGATVVAHELTHQFVFELLPQASRNAPWVSEALPDHQSGAWEPADLAKVREALARENVPAVETLTASDRHWGHAVFDFVAKEYGARGVREYVSVLRGGRQDSIRVAFDVSADDFNAGFRTYLRTYVADR